VRNASYRWNGRIAGIQSSCKYFRFNLASHECTKINVNDNIHKHELARSMPTINAIALASDDSISGFQFRYDIDI
jgi:hypothetical protein